MSLKNRILRYYQKNRTVWIPGTELERIVMQETTFVASNASRRCRDLVKEGKLERRLVVRNGKLLAEYRAPTDTPVENL